MENTPQNDEIEVLDGSELLERWQDQNKAWHFEGEGGMKKLEALVEVLGYRDTGFRYGTPIEAFLCDNPGACEKIVEFISEWADRNSEWRESLADATQTEDEEE